MKKLIGTAVLALFTAFAADAQCVGTDLRATLSSSEQQDLTRRVQQTPYAIGNHWLAEKDGTRLHIIGTVHLNDARLGPIATRLAPLFDTADRIWLEATAEEEQRLQDAVVERPELLFLTTGPTLPELLPEADWKALAEASRARGIPAFMAAKFQPWYMSVILSMPACAMAQVQSGESGLDNLLMEIAEQANVPQIALEPFDTVFQLMGTEPLEEQLALLRLGILPNSVAENSLTTLLASYFEENAVEVIEMARIVAKRHVAIPDAEMDTIFDDMLGSLLDTRNRAWVDTLASAPKGMSIVAVGAGHLPGEVGVLRLLEKAGFTLTRQPF